MAVALAVPPALAITGDLNGDASVDRDDVRLILDALGDMAGPGDPRDLDGDGLVEIAIGADWNPGETGDISVSGALFYLQRPSDPRNPWKPVTISPHEPTTHRMHWMDTDAGFHVRAAYAAGRAGARRQHRDRAASEGVRVMQEGAERLPRD